MWKYIEERDRSQTTMWCMRVACWIPEATNTLSRFVTLIAPPLQQWLHERASVLRYTYIACIVLLFISLTYSLYVYVILVHACWFVSYPLSCLLNLNVMYGSSNGFPKVFLYHSLYIQWQRPSRAVLFESLFIKWLSVNTTVTDGIGQIFLWRISNGLL